MRHQRGFLALSPWLLLAAGVAASAAGGVIYIQQQRLTAAHEAIGAEKVATAIALARIAQLSAAHEASEAALKQRDDERARNARALATAQARLKEVEHEAPEIAEALDCPVPDSVREFLRHHRGRTGSGTDADPAFKPAPGLPGAGGRSSDAPRANPSAAFVLQYAGRLQL